MPRERWNERETEETRVLPRARRGYAEERYERRPPPGSPVWPWLLLLLAIVLGGLAAVWYFTQADEPQRQPVPVVVRLPEQQARERLEADGFGVGVTRAADEAPPGTVFAQRPEGGELREEGSVVEISVSEGPATTPVPNVVGLPVADATERLQEAELRANAVEVFSQEPDGVVVSQNPTAGEEARRDSEVRINVSKGTGRTTVPDLVGLSREEAEAALEEAQLVASVVEVPSAEPAGTVVAQNPQGGQAARVGSRVRVNVSTGG